MAEAMSRFFDILRGRSPPTPTRPSRNRRKSAPIEFGTDLFNPMNMNLPRSQNGGTNIQYFPPSPKTGAAKNNSTPSGPKVVLKLSNPRNKPSSLAHSAEAFKSSAGTGRKRLADTSSFAKESSTPTMSVHPQPSTPPIHVPATGTSRKRPADTALLPDIANFTHECFICLAELMEPKLLHCGHNLCPECVNNPAINTLPTNMAGKSSQLATQLALKITCPMCQQVTESSGPLATNYALKETVAKAKRMKLHFEAKIDELSKPSASNDGKEPSITCADCGESCRQKRAFACIGQECASKLLVKFIEGEATQKVGLYGMWRCKELCAYCACRTHREHKLEEWTAMASKSVIGETIKNAVAMEEELRRLSNSQRDDGIGNVYELVIRTAYGFGEEEPAELVNRVVKVLSKCSIRLRENIKGLREPTGPLLKTVVETIDSKNRALLERVKAFINDKTEMKKHMEVIRQQVFNAFEEKNADLLK